jgi:hypothetical protein
MAMNELRGQAAMLHDELNRLAIKLAPVLAQPPGITETPTIGTSTPLGAGIAEMASMVSRARLYVATLTNEVAL